MTDAGASRGQTRAARSLLEWRVLIISLSLFLYSFGYGGITSFTALYADANGVTPKSIYLTALAIVILADAADGRPPRRSFWLQARLRALPGADLSSGSACCRSAAPAAG